jgi:formylglycine-generating enzyme required for sulfatase activity
MPRLFWISLTIALAGSIASHAQEKKDPPKGFTNSLGMKFVWVPPGSFMMGSPKEEEERTNFETQHKVTLTKGFYMGVYTVTQEQWTEVMGKNPSYFKGEKNLPVEQISWNDCQDFIKKLREKDKKLYRLPTEAEWEYSCRAGTTTAYYYGNDKRMLGQYAWYLQNSFNSSGRKTNPVGLKKPNAWGLYDMHGNVLQWCQDWHQAFLPEKDVVDPQGPEEGDNRVQRGGSCHSDTRFCRSASRHSEDPLRRNISTGLRVCFFLE